MKLFFKVLLIVVVLISGILITLLLIAPERVIKYIVPELNDVKEVDVLIKNDTAFLNLKVTVSNKSFLKLNIDSASYSLVLKQKAPIEGSKKTCLLLPPYGQDTLSLPVLLPYKKLLSQLKHQRGDSLGFDFELNLYYKIPFYKDKIKLPIKKTGKLKVPTPPEFELVKLHFENYKLSDLHMRAEIRVINRNDIKIKVDKMQYRINIKDMITAQGQREKDISIEPQSEITVMIPVRAKIEKIGELLLNTIRDKDTYSYSMTGKARISIDITKINSINLEIEKKGRTELIK